MITNPKKDYLPTDEAPKYSIEPHGTEYVLYYGRSRTSSGYNLCTISNIAGNANTEHMANLLNLGLEISNLTRKYKT